MQQELLKRCPCYLIQSGHFKNNIHDIEGRKDIIELNYMGSAEFEGGELFNSTKRMLVNMEFYDFFSFPNYVNEKEESLMVYAPRMYINHIANIVDRLANSSYGLKKYCTLNDVIRNYDQIFKTKDDFWWDIENDFYIFFGEDHAHLIKEAQIKMLENKKIKLGDWDELAEYYLLKNPDLSEEAIQFLQQKKSNSIKRYIKKIRVQRMNK